jgi:Na+-transporting NADH:ubiquinone oxidoreductase subunit NqrF
MGNVEAEGNRVSCERLSNFMITNISGNIVSIKNAGGTIINASHFSGFINNVPIQIQNTDILLKPGDFVNIQLGQTPVVGNRVKIIGDCKVGDEFYVK